jgi:hypothetical protein
MMLWRSSSLATPSDEPRLVPSEYSMSHSQSSQDVLRFLLAIIDTTDVTSFLAFLPLLLHCVRWDSRPLESEILKMVEARAASNEAIMHHFFWECRSAATFREPYSLFFRRYFANLRASYSNGRNSKIKFCSFIQTRATLLVYFRQRMSLRRLFCVAFSVASKVCRRRRRSFSSQRPGSIFTKLRSYFRGYHRRL